MQTDFEQFNQWVTDRLGVQLAAYKESQMQRRILTIMENSGAKNLKEYQRLLEKDAVAREAFLTHITINVTEFYRNKELFDAFEKTLLTKIIPQFHLPKIWSAACSIGAEPYTIAMILEKNRLATPTVLATDIDQQILAKAKEGVYRKSELRNVPSGELASYFDVTEKNAYQIKPELKRKVHFKKHDLLKDPYEKNNHVIVCRNVTIYFKSDARDEVYQKFSDALVPGGILFTGATETINFSEKFGLKKIDSFIYQKV
jgi:chemotaxis protein methyltransferase CheR